MKLGSVHGERAIRSRIAWNKPTSKFTLLDDLVYCYQFSEFSNDPNFRTPSAASLWWWMACARANQFVTLLFKCLHFSFRSGGYRTFPWIVVHNLLWIWSHFFICRAEIIRIFIEFSRIFNILWRFFSFFRALYTTFICWNKFYLKTVFSSFIANVWKEDNNSIFCDILSDPFGFRTLFELHSSVLPYGITSILGYSVWIGLFFSFFSSSTSLFDFHSSAEEFPRNSISSFWNEENMNDCPSITLKLIHGEYSNTLKHHNQNTQLQIFRAQCKWIRTRGGKKMKWA